MAVYSRTEFIRQVLLELGVLDPNEAAEASDHEGIDSRTQQKFEELYEEGLIPFDLDGEIPARYFLPLVRIVACECLNLYGQQDKAAILEANAASGVRQLWKLRQRPYVGNPTAATYY